MTTLEVETYQIQLAVDRRSTVQATEQGLHCEVDGWQQEVRVQDAVARDALAGLAIRPATSAELVQGAMSDGGDLSAAMAVHLAQAKLLAVGALEYRVIGSGGRLLATLGSAGALPVTLQPMPPDDVDRSLSPHLVATPADGAVVVESGVSQQQVRLDPDLFAAAVAGRVDEVPAPVLDLLHSAGLWLTEAESSSREMRQWDAADLWFHRKVTECRRGPGYGGTFRLANEFEPLPFDREVPEGTRCVDLPVPDLTRADEPTVAEAMENRRSVRSFAPGATTLGHLAAVLYRTLRTRGTFVAEGGLEVVDRLYPSGGAIHELDAYVLADDVVGLDRGLYRYDSRAHRLVEVCDDERRLDTMATEARLNAAAESAAPAVLLLSARFGRLMWKYQGMAYSLLTKHVGVVYEALYLAAHAERLGVCGLGGCSSRSFIAATGLDPMAEDVVGQLVLGVPEPNAPESWRQS